MFFRKSVRKISNNSKGFPRSPSPSRNRSPAGEHNRSSLGVQRVGGVPGPGDICATHRGHSPTASPKPRRKISTSGYKVASPSPSPSLKSPALSRKSSSSRHLTIRKSSVRSRKTEENESVLSFRPSPRSRKLYRFKNNFSDGASEESDVEDWFLKEKYQRSRKNGMNLKKGGHNRKSKLSMPAILIQDYSDRDHKKIPKLKMRAVSGFSNGRGISPEPVHRSRDSKAMAKLKIKALHQFSNGRSHQSPEPPLSSRDYKAMAKLKIKALHQFSSGRAHKSPEPPRETRRKIGSTKNKIFAVNCFRNGREITEYVEVTDSELENSDIGKLSEDEVETKNTTIDDPKQIIKPEDDGDTKISKSDEIKQVDSIPVEETDQQSIDNSTSTLEVN